MVFGIALGCNVFLLLSLSLLLVILNFVSFNINKHIFFVLFLIAFYVFLMGGVVMHDFFEYPMSYEYSNENFSHLNICILLSLIFISLGYILGRNKDPKKTYETKKMLFMTEDKITQFKSWSKRFFYVLCIPWYVILAEDIYVSQTLGYLSYYSYDSNLPWFVSTLANTCPYFLCFFLSTYPSKLEAKTPLCLIFIYATLSIFTGRRIFFVTYYLFLFGYLFIRNLDDLDNEVWITKRNVVFLVTLAPLLVSFLYVYKFIRYNMAITDITFFDAFCKFFVQQGVTANLIPIEKIYEDNLKDVYYSFYDTLRFLRTNIVSKYIFDMDYSKMYFGTREEQAAYGNSYAMQISYLIMKKGYLYGFGLGSCYIAELYHDFGYIGVCLGNLVYGFIIKTFLVLHKGDVIRNVIGLLMFRGLLMAPRYNFDFPIRFLYSSGFWIIVVLLFICVYVTSHKLATNRIKNT